MALSKQSVETLMDLVEIKISYMDVLDRDDAKELRVLERCRDELKAANSNGADVLPLSSALGNRTSRAAPLPAKTSPRSNPSYPLIARAVRACVWHSGTANGQCDARRHRASIR